MVINEFDVNLYSNGVLFLNYIKLVILFFVTFLNIYIIIKNREKPIIHKHIQLLLIIFWLYLVFDNVESIMRFYGLEFFYDEMRNRNMEILFQSEIDNINTNNKIDSLFGRMYDDIQIEHYKDSIQVSDQNSKQNQ